MIRLYHSGDLSDGQLVDLETAQAHYLCNVMRKKIGDDLLLFNEKSGEWLGKLEEVSKKSACVILEKQTRKPEPEPDIWLLFAPIKKQRLDFLIEKATELGVSRLIPVMTRRTIVSKIRDDRLESQVIEAAEQCERLSIPVISKSQSLKDCIENWQTPRKLFILNEQGGAKPLQQTLAEIDKNTPCAILVGPEGGFDRSELDLALKKPFVTPVSLGPRILRAETAALSALTCWQSVLGDWQDPLRMRVGPTE